MAELFTNYARSLLAVAIGPAVLTVEVTPGDGALFPAPGVGDHFYVTVENPVSRIQEIMKCTARSGDTLTVERAQQGTTALTHSVGYRVELRPTRGTLENFVQRAELSNYVPTSAAEPIVMAQTLEAPQLDITDGSGVGYQYLTGGRILQWGTITGSVDAAHVVTLPEPLPTALDTVIVVPMSSLNDNLRTVQVYDLTTTGFKVRRREFDGSAIAQGTFDCTWLAVGR